MPNRARVGFPADRLYSMGERRADNTFLIITFLGFTAPTKMRALRFSEEKGLRLEVVPKPNVDIGEALIKLLRVGICSTDLEITRGYVPGFDFTLGHEFVGVVVEENKSPGDGNPSLIGKRVVGEINCRCCECHHPDPIFVRVSHNINKLIYLSTTYFNNV